jgi:hypothetical protein
MKRAAGFLIALSFVFSVAGVPPARSGEAEEAEGGIPAYAVARVKVLDGSVWVRPSDGGEWEEYASNSPLPPRSRVSVPEGSEAELQFHGGQFVLLTSGTDLEVRDLQDGKSVFRLRAGEIRFDLPPDEFAPVSVRVPGGAIARFPEPGRQWLTVTEDDETRLVVRRGRAVVTLDGDEHPLRAGQEAVIGQDITVSEYRGGEDDTASVPPPPEPEGAAPPAVVDELRDYGEWITVPTYGQVWRPRVAVGWSPYVYGRWSWISPYGWTWVSSEPWGWYPYRCGYWLTDPVFGWFWSPYNAFVSVDFVFGSHRYRHHNAFYRPANVRFIPEGRDVRWVPLRPGERFRPAEFRRGDTRLSQWNRPLDTGRVFVRGGTDRREWREYKAVHAERQMELRKTRAAQPRPDTRRVRPESRDSRAPFAVERKKSAEPRKSEKAVRDRSNRSAPGEGRGIERRPTTPSGRPAGESRGPVVRPERGTGAPKEAAPGPGQAVRESPPPRVPPSREVVRPEGKRGVVQERAPAVRAPDAGSGGREFREERGNYDRGRGGDRGEDRGGDRGGGRGR